MQMRRIIASLAVGLLASAGFATGASAAPPSKPVVTASVTSQDGATVEIGYGVNRGAKQIATVTYSLNGGDPLPAPAPTSGKKSSTGSFPVTAVDGQNTLTVTVNLTDGGSATSNHVTFTYIASYAKAGCFELALPGYYLETDGSNPQIFPPDPTNPGMYLLDIFVDSDCSVPGGFGQARAMVWAGDSASALSLCQGVGGSRVVAQTEPYFYGCI
jgi:hypothetical protein